MPVTNDGYVKESEDSLQDAIEAQLQADFDEDIDLTDGSTFTILAELVSGVLNANQEASLQDVYESAFLDTATGSDLEKVVALIGLQRRPASHATGVQQFLGPKATADTVIQNGTTVQTGGGDPIAFETTEVTSLQLVDDFEDNNLTEWGGDTVDASVVSANPYRGNDSLKLDAVAGAHLYRTDTVLRRGSIIHQHAFARTNTIPVTTFFVQESDPTDYYQVSFDEANDEVRLEVVTDGSVSSTLDTASVTINSGVYYEAEVDAQITGDIDVDIKDADGNFLVTLTGSDGTYDSGYLGAKSGDANAEKNVDFYTTSAVSANARAVVGGGDGNVGSTAVTNLVSPIAGINSTRNRYPYGDASYTDLSGDSYRAGNDEESDEELRERARAATTGGGAATHDAITSALINDVQNVTSVSLFENKTDVDNTGSGGLPPHSFEAVVFGGTDSDVAETIFDEKAVTARDYGGANGTLVTETVTSDVTGDTRQISFSRPTQVNVDVTMEIVVTDEYIGDEALRDRVVDYIGGVMSDGSTERGLGVEEDVVLDKVRDVVVGDDTGVYAFDNSVDGNPLTTTPAATTVSGVEVVDIGATEVAYTDATDGSISITTTTL